MLFIEPHAGPAPIIRVIRQARREVSVGVYYLSDRPILRSLAAARRRGVDVRVIIEGRPYGMKPWTVRREERAIEETGARLHLAPHRFTGHGRRYAFYHAKYVCNGHECVIGTANFDWSAFHRNREYLYLTRNPAVVRAVNAVFAADWNDRRAPAYAHRVLVLSPASSVAQLLEIIRQPGPIDVESEELGPYRPLLDALAAKGRELRMILPARIDREDRRDVAFLLVHGCRVRLLPDRPIYMHAKMIVGGRWAFIGSENFTWISLEKNREMGLRLSGPDLIRLRRRFDEDWKRADPP